VGKDGEQPEFKGRTFVSFVSFALGFSRAPTGDAPGSLVAAFETSGIVLAGNNATPGPHQEENGNDEDEHPAEPG